uniref:Metaxin n=1 Tax=Panagrolaimus superbus TaxID=310955 RepID=A0A914YUI1_9BILA
MSSSFFLQKTVNETLNQADAEWKDVYLITPMSQEQSLLYEYAECLAVHSLLKMVDLPYRAQQRPNAVDMSPSRRVPFLRIDETIIADFPRIVDFIELKGVKMSNTRTAAESTDLQALVSLLDEDLRHVEMYIVWIDNETYSKVTKPRCASVHQFPLSLVLPHILRNSMKTYLSDRGYAQYSMQKIISIADSVFRTLSIKLGTRHYIVGDQPSELDSLAFGHLFTILTTELPCLQLINTLKKYHNLIDYCTRMESELFHKTESVDS